MQKLSKELETRCAGKCELCGSDNNVTTYIIPPDNSDNINNVIAICETCYEQINGTVEPEANHWRCLNDSMWSEVAGVQIVAWRMLNRLKHEGWPQDLLDMMYLDEETLSIAASTGEGANDDTPKHKDSNGAELKAGDTVVLIKDLNVKGANFTAKRGTAVRNISLVHDNHEHIEGRVNGQQIVILTQYVKKQ